jgi:hypothetical protein
MLKKILITLEETSPVVRRAILAVTVSHLGGALITLPIAIIGQGLTVWGCFVSGALGGTATSLFLLVRSCGRRQSHPRGFWIDLLLPPDRAEEALVNLLGRYDHWVAKHGTARARFIFASQSFGCILSFWTDWLLRRAKLLRLLRKS